VEDPVRILRVARFSARLSHLGFEVAPETMRLMRTMVKSGEVDALVPERVWAETARALSEPNPGRYVNTLKECGALKHIFPEIDALFGVPQPATHHPEIDTGTHILMALDQATQLGADTAVRFAVLVHDLGKATTPPDDWPHHIGHEQRGIPIIRELSRRLRVPSQFRDLGVLAAEHHTHCHRALELRPKTLLKVLQSLDALRRPERFEQFLLACEADARGRLGFEKRAYPQAGLLRCARETAASLAVAPLRKQYSNPKDLIDAIYKKRLEAVEDARSRFIDNMASFHPHPNPLPPAGEGDNPSQLRPNVVAAKAHIVTQSFMASAACR
jgi:tRNA nucleotidyltransferase (CCA-adding enzyme)